MEPRNGLAQVKRAKPFRMRRRSLSRGATELADISLLSPALRPAISALLDGIRERSVARVQRAEETLKNENAGEASLPIPRFSQGLRGGAPRAAYRRFAGVRETVGRWIVISS
jgi:hypothetical protein